MSNNCYGKVSKIDLKNVSGVPPPPLVWSGCIGLVILVEWKTAFSDIKKYICKILSVAYHNQEKFEWSLQKYLIVQPSSQHFAHYILMAIIHTLFSNRVDGSTKGIRKSGGTMWQ